MFEAATFAPQSVHTHRHFSMQKSILHRYKTVCKNEELRTNLYARVAKLALAPFTSSSRIDMWPGGSLSRKRLDMRREEGRLTLRATIFMVIDERFRSELGKARYWPRCPHCSHPSACLMRISPYMPFSAPDGQQDADRNCSETCSAAAGTMLRSTPTARRTIVLK